MMTLIEELADKNFQELLQLEKINKYESAAETNRKKLKNNLNKKQRKLLLGIVDAKDSIAEQCGYESFAAGFKLGLKIGYETNKN